MVMNIYQKIIEVQKVCTYVKKDSEVGYGNNKYKAGNELVCGTE